MSGYDLSAFQIGSGTLTSLLIVGAGVLGCFFGYRLFRLTLGVYGFLLGAGLGGAAAEAIAEGNSAALLVAALIGGVLGALLLALLYRVGVFVIGAVAGLLFANAAGTVLDMQLQWWAFIICAVAIGVLALVFQRVVIVLATAALGAWTIVSGAVALSGGQALSWEGILGGPLLWERTDLPQIVVFIAWLVLAVAGALVQFKGSRGE